MKEIWKKIPNYLEKYEVSNKGNARILDHTRKYKFTTTTVKGRDIIISHNDTFGITRQDGKRMHINIKTAVYLAFVGEVPANHCILYKDKTKAATPDNLFAATYSEKSKIMHRDFPFIRKIASPPLKNWYIRDDGKKFNAREFRKEYGTKPNYIFIAVKFNRRYKGHYWQIKEINK